MREGLGVGSEPLLFDAWAKYHQTEPWTGHRLVLVTWVVQQLHCLEESQVSRARELGFVLPPEIAPQLETAQSSRNMPYAFELFAGKGSLSRALRQAGFKVLSFDHSHCDSQVPLVQLDLASRSGQDVLWGLLTTSPPFALHLGVPCGTSSQARGRPLVNGARGPQPLRSKDHPLGLPSLNPKSADFQRVRTANELYAFTYRILRYCIMNNIIVCVENPQNSFLWDILRAFEPAAIEDQILHRLVEVCFDQCCHGGLRPKSTKFLCTPGCFETLQAQCPGNHPHQPWGQIVEFGSVRFATKDEAAYPQILAARCARCLARQAASAGHVLVASPATKDQSLALLGRQNRRQKPLVSEYLSVHWQPAADFKPHLT